RPDPFKSFNFHGEPFLNGSLTISALKHFVSGAFMSDQPGLDVSIFDTVIETGDAQARIRLALDLAGLIGSPGAPESERNCVVPTVLKLATDPVKDVRCALADKLVGAADLNGDILFSIIADEDDIALPFLAATPALDPWKMRSIARVG